MKKRLFRDAMATSGLASCMALLTPASAAGQTGPTQPAVAAAADKAPSTDVAPATRQASSGDIIVTARRRAENVQDVPISITAISGDGLRKAGVENIATLQAIVPSLSITNAGVQRDSFTFAIRGQRTNEIQLLTDPPVATYFAEVVQPRPFGFGNTLYDIGSVQVLKGVQGTLFGRNVTGGAVLVEPNRPTTDRVAAEIRGQYGNYDMHDLYGMVNLPLGEWGAVRVAGKTHRRDGFTIDQSNGRDYDDENYDTVRASLLLRPVAGVESVTIGDWYRSRQHGTASIPEVVSLFNPATNSPTVLGQLEGTRAAGAAGLAGPASPLLAMLPNIPAQLAAIRAGRQSKFFSFDTAAGDGGRLDAFGRAPYADLDNWGVTNRTTIDLGFATLKNIAGYRKVDYERLSDLDGFPAFLINSVQTTRVKQYNEELQLQGEAFARRLNYTVGAYYFQEKGLDGSTSSQFPELTLLGLSGAGVPINPFTTSGTTVLIANPSRGSAISKAVYAAGTFTLSDKFKLSGGVRYNYDKRRITTSASRPNLFGGSCALDLDSNGVPDALTLAQCTVSRSKSYDAFTYDVTLQYEPNPGLTTYLSTRRGFRSGGFNLRAQNGIELTPFEPETVQEYEVGLKTRNRVGPATLTSSFAAFYQDYQNVQKQNASVNGAGIVGTVVTNTTKQRNYGGEAEVGIRFDGGFSTNMAYSYVGAEIVRGGNGTFTLVGVPNHQISVSAAYEREIGSAGTFSINSNLSFKSRQHLDDRDVEGDQPAYALVNMRAQLADIGGSNLSIAGFVSNLTNERYRVGVTGLLDTVGYLASIYGTPRTYGVEIGYRF